MIRLDEISLLLGGRYLLQEASLQIHREKHVGFVGVNGCGKSSLFALLSKKLQPDAGNIEMPGNMVARYSEQETSASKSSAIDYVIDGDQKLRFIEGNLEQAKAKNDTKKIAHWLAEYDAHNGYSALARAAKLLTGLGFSQGQLQKPFLSFSGGWRMRLHLSRILMAPSDTLLLDEPTNHLDLDAIIWLEKYIQSYQGTVIVISHDRDFLDAVAEDIIHMDAQKLTYYQGNYSQFEKAHAMQLMQQKAVYKKQQQIRQHILSYVERFRAKASKAKQAQSRLKALERMEEIAPMSANSHLTFEFVKPDRCPSMLLRVRELVIGYDKPLANNIDFDILANTRLGLLGKNGAGKSTLIKTLAKVLPKINGQIYASEHLRIGYFNQHQLDTLDVSSTPILHLQRLAPDISEQKIRDFLAGFGFAGDKAKETIENFSGGECTRLMLAIVAWQKPNLLLLDEPTNHLDLEARNSLILALQGFEGAIILVSHDRHLLRNAVDELVLVDNNSVTNWNNDLDSYSLFLAQNKFRNESSTSKDKSEQKMLRQKQSELRKTLQKLKKEIQGLEAKMEVANVNMLQIEQLLSDSTIYESENKSKLDSLLVEQANLHDASQSNEHLWLGKQTEIEQLEFVISQGKVGDSLQ